MNHATQPSGPAPGDEFPQTPARQVVVAVVRGYGMVQRLMGPYFARFGITPPQFQLLTVLNHFGDRPVTQRQLAAALYVSFPNVTVLLSRLEKAKLIARRWNPHDRREKFVVLTPRGKGLLHRIWQRHQAQLDHVVAGLDADEQAQLARLLTKLIAAHDTPTEAKSGRKRPAHRCLDRHNAQGAVP